MFRRVFQSLAVCAGIFALGACAATPLTAQSQPADVVSLLIGEWMGCNTGDAAIMKFTRGNSSDTIQMKMSGIRKYKNADCTGKAEITVSMDEMIKLAKDQAGLQINGRTTLKIDELKPTTDSLFVAQYSGYSQGEMRYNGKVQFVKQPRKGMFYINADGSYLKWSDSFGSMELKRSK